MKKGSLIYTLEHKRSTEVCHKSWFAQLQSYSYAFFALLGKLMRILIFVNWRRSVGKGELQVMLWSDLNSSCMLLIGLACLVCSPGVYKTELILW